MRVQVDRNGDDLPDAESTWREVYGGRNEIDLSGSSGARWRVQFELHAPQDAPLPAVRSLRLRTQQIDE
jgi:hypothetical protein